MDEIDVPTHFLCPISLQLMKDPVKICTGITYDRENIEKWLFSCNNKTCPVTKQSLLLDTNLTPNHTLCRLIQSWCTLNASLGVQRIPTPKTPIDKAQILKLINEAKRFPDKQLKCLRKLRSFAFEGGRNKNCMESTGAIDFLASTMNCINNIERVDSTLLSELAIEVLFHLNPSEGMLKKLINNEGIHFLESLFQVLRLGNFQSRAYATMLLKSAFEVADPMQLMSVKTVLFVEIMRVLRDKISNQASKAALKIIVELCPWGRNRIKGVEGGAVLVLIELLLDAQERRLCELILAALDQLCGCAEGRAEFLNHGAGLAIVSKKILRVSHVASDKGVRILASICRYSATCRVLHEMLQVGVVSKLCLVLQVNSSLKTKERAKEILKLHSMVWKNSPCIPLPLLSSYP
ncbi:PREDICTED: E3 ubiquitin-protein ligase PUB23-like [Lupinus angustifolius]|uniref:E3 ubiquitin-protein ligase PUB23-like n=1 Tax=Lupinus angustifolius TaxID=3871 RepID=UPI00092E78EA|nr:PREDICTED: E3 ubiquitin-protein ligase PUB23-like [Lupinus angustifolius]